MGGRALALFMMQIAGTIAGEIVRWDEGLALLSGIVRKRSFRSVSSRLLKVCVSLKHRVAGFAELSHQLKHDSVISNKTQLFKS